MLGGSRRKITTDITISVNPDFVNIKLMKCGGLYSALKIASAAEVYGVECMIGCMLEAKVSVNAAVHLACAKNIITKVDLDDPGLGIRRSEGLYIWIKIVIKKLRKREMLRERQLSFLGAIGGVETKILLSCLIYCGTLNSNMLSGESNIGNFDIN